MKVLRRAALFVVVPLAVALVAGYAWYRTSETGKRWRYEDRLTSYCAGLIPLEESAVFNGYDTEVGLSLDRQRNSGADAFHSCKVADLKVSVGQVPAEAGEAPMRGDSILGELAPRSQDFLPMALGGGWYGYTDLHSTGIVLACTNRPGYVVVDVESDASHTNRQEARDVAELAAGVGRKAADHWSCAAERGGPVPPLPELAGESLPQPQAATGTCQGLSIPYDDLQIHWIKESRASAATPVERCVLGETRARAEELYWLSASYGPYAQARRAATYDSSLRDEPAGVAPGRAWATASCPGAPKALLTITATEYANGADTRFLVDTLSAFAERSVKRHGCTDLQLPSGR